MFDFHMHSNVSKDGKAAPEEMVAAAERCGLREICFTDHLDRKVGRPEHNVFAQEDYERAYRGLRSDKVKLHFGMEFGMMTDNRELFLEETAKRQYDFIIGSLHNIGDLNVVEDAFWAGRTQKEIYTFYLEELLRCLEVHRDFHVLGHLTHPTKVKGNPEHTPYTLKEYGDLTGEIFKRLISMGIGIEVNTSGIRSSGQPLPPLEFVRQYVELGGEILTIGSDAHQTQHVGYHIPETLAQLKEITPWICTFEGGKPIFHRIDSLI